MNQRALLLISIPYGRPRKNKYVKRRYELNEITVLLKSYFKFICCYYQNGRAFHETPDRAAHSLVIACTNQLDEKLDTAETLEHLIERKLHDNGTVLLPVGVEYLKQKITPVTATGNQIKGKVLVFHHPVPVYDNLYVSYRRYQQYFVLGENLQRIGWDVWYFCNDETRRYFGDDNCVSPSDFGSRPDAGNWVSMYRRTILGGQSDENEIKPLHDLYKAVIDKVNPDVVFTWNVNGILKDITESRDLLLIHNEVSIFRKPYPASYFYDPAGVTAGSSIKQLWNEKYCKEQISPDQLALVARLRNNLVLSKHKFTSTDEIRARLGLTGEKLILILLQVEQDSNIIAYAPFSSMAEYLEACLPHVQEDFGIIIKQHPCEFGTPGFGRLELGTNVRVVRDEFSVLDLANASDYVFTINSTGGFEALMLHKRVFVFGDAFYSGLGMTIDIKDDLPEKVRSIPAALSDDEKALIDRFIYFMIFQYSVFDDVMWDTEAQSKVIEKWIALRKEKAPLASYWEALHSVQAVDPASRCGQLIDGYSRNLCTELEKARQQLRNPGGIRKLKETIERQHLIMQEKDRLISSIVSSMPYKILDRAVRLKGKLFK